MIQGTASHVGKSVLVAAFCRLFARAGYRVAPFKAQNMSNNSFVTLLGGEIGRAQAFQAQAAGVEPHVDMNPVLLKPSADTVAQVVLLGQPVGAMTVGDYHAYQAEAWDSVTGALARLRAEYDLVIMEGAGSPAEINLRDRDIVNMRVALHARAPVLLLGDIERGGVFASLVGTMSLLSEEERRCVRGFLINKFRGDASLLAGGLDFLLQETGVPVLGVLPYVFGLPVDEEDAVSIPHQSDRAGPADLEIGVVHFPHISNATDFEPLLREPDVSLRYIDRAATFGQRDLVILPGTKSTAADLAWLRRQGLEAPLRAHIERGGWVIGICGGYQMMGLRVCDPEGVESSRPRLDGLGLLPVVTEFRRRKQLLRVEARCLLAGMGEAPVRGYEIHQGQSRIEGGCTPAFEVIRQFDEAVREPEGAALNPALFGTYIHGLFDHGGFRRTYLNELRRSKGLAPLPSHAHDTHPKDFDQLADWAQDSVDVRAVCEIVGLPLRAPTSRRQTHPRALP
jgi:adenosylcobyric acid synthase